MKMGNVNREMETIKKIKNSSEMKTASYGFVIRHNIGEERISESVNRPTEIYQPETQREKDEKEKKNRITHLRTVGH